MLTPRDIHEADFKRVWKGYNPDEVDAFLRRVVGAYETVYRANEGLKKEIEELKARLEEYSKTEVQIDDTLRMAKQAASDAKEAAMKEAEATLRDAQSEARRIVEDAHREVALEERRLHELRAESDALKRRLRNLMEDFMNRLDSETNFEDSATRRRPALREVTATTDDGGEREY